MYSSRGILRAFHEDGGRMSVSKRRLVKWGSFSSGHFKTEHLERTQ